ncbi:hypothetical protein [Saccharopolyspora sp. 5N708]|uniref:hypothetical protein n=1 Tax=Saccharopolyspora sp. 5N708 TaxID=3457424 RepID=UPI003FD1DA26
MLVDRVTEGVRVAEWGHCERQLWLGEVALIETLVWSMVMPRRTTAGTATSRETMAGTTMGNKVRVDNRIANDIADGRAWTRVGEMRVPGTTSPFRTANRDKTADRALRLRLIDASTGLAGHVPTRTSRQIMSALHHRRQDQGE